MTGDHLTDTPAPTDPCNPSPCGPNSRCQVNNNQGICSCNAEFIGSPPNCRPECTVSSECSAALACLNQKCRDPCPGTCGNNASCRVINHSPICGCNPGSTGDPFVQCFPMLRKYHRTRLPVSKSCVYLHSYIYLAPIEGPKDPCSSSPCGPNAICRTVGNSPSCACVNNYIGSPPNCRPECSIHPDCTSDKACIREKCRDPCPGSCGLSARCAVVNHVPVCTCPEGFTGDPFTNCGPTPPPADRKIMPRIVDKLVNPLARLILSFSVAPAPRDPCNPSPCGPNSQCRNGQCTCLPEYLGDPYFGCRPECVTNEECPRNRACVNQKCLDPCSNACGISSLCSVINHLPMCSCPQGTSGNAFIQCSPMEEPVVSDPCNPSPCGPNSHCRQNNNQAVCTCIPGYFGTPPSCRPECVVSSDCPRDRACNTQKCIDPCLGTCGFSAQCVVINHNPICSCSSGMTGDPFTRCFPLRKDLFDSFDESFLRCFRSNLTSILFSERSSTSS